MMTVLARDRLVSSKVSNDSATDEIQLVHRPLRWLETHCRSTDVQATTCPPELAKTTFEMEHETFGIPLRSFMQALLSATEEGKVP